MHKHTFFLGALIAALLFPLSAVRADENESSGSGFTIGVEAANSEESSYVKYKVKADDTQKFAVLIDNKERSAQKFDLSVISAGTSSQGTIAYTAGSDTINVFQPKLSEMVSPAKKSVTVPGNSKQAVEFALTVPEGGISGDVLGAVYVKKDATTTSSGKMGIQNAFAMSMPVHLYSEDQPKVMPKLSLSKSKLAKSGNNAVIETRLANAAARFFGHISIKTQVVNAAGKKIASTELKDAEMAPAAAMNHTIPVKSSKLAAGDYTVKTKLTSGSKTYNLSDTFKVKDTAIKATISKLPDTKTVDNSKWQWALAAMAALSLMLLIALIVVARKKKGSDA